MALVVSLIADPAKHPLDPALVGSLRDAWGGGDVVWLSQGEAAEFAVPALPGNHVAVWSDVQGMGADLAITEAAKRRKRLLLADMDSTVIVQECIDELADEAGVGDEVRGITARAMNGELDFKEALRARVALLEGLEVGVIADALTNRITLAAGAKTLLATLRARGVHTALVSGGFTAFTSQVAQWLGFDENRANTLIIKDGHLTGEVAEPILGRDAKVAALTEISGTLGIEPQEAVAVGDGANDLGMIHAAGLGVALHAKPAVAAEAPVRINHGDLTALLFLQGIPRAEFRTA
ncbi:MAG: phosphoserine phosphatase SerB [Pseudomonadota bacterium]